MIQPGTWCWIVRLPAWQYGNVLNGRVVEVVGEFNGGFCPIMPFVFVIGNAKYTCSGVSPLHLMDINPSDTLSYREAREHDDERHIAPLQLQVIERCVNLWSNPGDTVFSPFAGIGSEGYVALRMGRKFLGSELKRSYWEQSCRNLDAAQAQQSGLFAA